MVNQTCKAPAIKKPKQGWLTPIGKVVSSIFSARSKPTLPVQPIEPDKSMDFNYFQENQFSFKSFS